MKSIPFGKLIGHIINMIFLKNMANNSKVACKWKALVMLDMKLGENDTPKGIPKYGVITPCWILNQQKEIQSNGESKPINQNLVLW